MAPSTSSPHPDEEEIFNSALSLPPGQRRAFVEKVCGDDQLRVSRLMALIEAHGERDFMANPAPASVLECGDGAEGDRIGPYKLLQRVGTGGFGTVWMAEQREPIQRRVAIKVIKLGMDTREVLARFDQERRALALMDHPNIASIYDAGATPSGRPYIAMEFVRGVTLTEYCDEEQLGTDERLRLFLQLCHALQHAHQKGIIHRDLKPSNILVTLIDGKPVLKVIDFGVAKATQASTNELTLYTQLEQMVGTPLYMSPEQTGSLTSDIDTRSDIYSMGVLLYCLLTGSPPIDESTLSSNGRDEVRRMIREIDPPRPSVRVRQYTEDERTSIASRLHLDPARWTSRLRGDLDWIVMKCLEKDRERRYETANALRLDIERHLNDEPVLARHPGTLYLVHKAYRRHRGLFASAAVVLLTLTAATIVSGWSALRARDAEQAEKQLRKVADENRQRAEAGEAAALLHAYEADMSAAALVHAKGDLGYLARILKRNQPEEEAPDFRGWEWHFLSQQLEGDQEAVLRGHEDMVTSVVFTGQGRRLVSGDHSGQLHLWDVGTGRSIARIDTELGRIRQVTVSHDDRLLAAGGDAGVKLWTIPDFELVQTLPMIRTRPTFSPTDPVLLLGANDNWFYGVGGVAKLWEYEKDPEAEQLRELAEGGTRATFSADGRILATGVGTEQKVTLREPETGALLGKFPLETVLQLAIANDGRWVAATTPRLGMPRLWTGQGDPLGELSPEGGDIFSLAASPTANELATGSSGQRIAIWDMDRLALKETLMGHQNEVKTLAYSPDGQWLASGSTDETVRLWQIGKSRLADTRSDMLAAFAIGLPALSPDGRLLAAVTEHSVLKLYHTDSLQEFLPIGYRRLPMRFSPDGSRLVTMLYYQGRALLEVWDTQTGENLGGRILNGNPFSESQSALSPDGSFLGLANRNWLHFFHVPTGEEFFYTDAHGGIVLATAFSPDGKRHAAAAQDGNITLRSVPEGETLHVFSHKQDARGLAFSPDGKWLATGAHDNLIKVWDVRSGNLVAELHGHSQVVNFLRFSPDGQTLFSSGDERDLFLWRAGSWRSLGSYPIPALTRSMEISANGAVLSVGSHPSHLKLFRVPDIGMEPVPGDWVLDQLPYLSWGTWHPIPPRDPDVPDRCVDLTGHYSASLTTSWSVRSGNQTEAWSLAEIPMHGQEFAGVPWDIRGVVQVQPRDPGDIERMDAFPESVSGMRIGRKVGRWHLLAGAILTRSGHWQKEIGQITVHYTDGQTVRKPLVLGVDVLDWVDSGGEETLEALQAPVIWRGENAATRGDARSLRLTHISWENERPEAEVAAIALTATLGHPFLVAVTTEP